MKQSNEYIAQKLRNWKDYLNAYELPLWENIPDIGLYMEQVIALLKQYLDYLPPELKEEQFITAATINNYVRLKVIPEPVKKKYYRIHIAYLIIVLTLKKGVAISLIQRLVPSDMEKEAIKDFYGKYSDLHKKSCTYFAKEVAKIAAPILENGQEADIKASDATELVACSAVISSFSHLLSEKILLLE